MCLPHTLPLHLRIHEDLMTKVRQLPSAASTYMVCKWIQLCHMCALVGDLTDVVPFNRCLEPLLQLKHKLNKPKKNSSEKEDIIPEQPESFSTWYLSVWFSIVVWFLFTVESSMLSSSVISFINQSPSITHKSDQRVKWECCDCK